MEIIRCTLKEFKEEFLKPNQIAEIIDTDRNGKRTIAIRSKDGRIEYMNDISTEVMEEVSREESIETNPETITIIDRNGIPHRLFVGYNISEEDLKEIERRYCNGK